MATHLGLGERNPPAWAGIVRAVLPPGYDLFIQSYKMAIPYLGHFERNRDPRSRPSRDAMILAMDKFRQYIANQASPSSEELPFNLISMDVLSQRLVALDSWAPNDFAKDLWPPNGYSWIKKVLRKIASLFGFDGSL